MIKEKTRKAILKALSGYFSKDITDFSEQAIGGGDINEAYKLTTPDKAFFIKLNSASRFPGMFEKETRGLRLLQEPGVIRVPAVILHEEENDESFLILEYIKSSGKGPDFWENFGKSLAELHQNTADYCGLDHDNYIGSLHQYNNKHPDWISFFIEERLEPQLKLARDDGKIDDFFSKMFDNLYKHLEKIFPKEPSALLHGDLWNGNFMIDDRGEACIIDPAVYYGHREMDLGMSKLFGGFSSEFYAAYDEAYPLEKDWKKRTDICNLYPLMVHVNLFGGGYAASVRNIIKRF